MILQRTDYLANGIFGTFASEDGSLSFISLEHAWPVIPDTTKISQSFAPKIPVGIYTCQKRISPKFGYAVFLIENVPNIGVDPSDAGKEFCDFIEIHRGCYNSDSDGCVLLATTIAPDYSMVLQSKIAFNKFMNAMIGINQFSLTVK